MQNQFLENAIALHKMGQLIKADAIYKKLSEENPKNYQILYLRGLVSEALNKNIEATKFFKAAHSLSTMDPEICFHLGMSFKKINSLKKSNLFYEKTIALNPYHLEAYVNLANNLTSQHLFKKASTYYLQAINLNPSLATTYFNFGTMHLKAMDPDSAIHFLKKAVDLDRNNANYLNALGVAETEIGNLQEGANAFENAHLNDPHFMEPLFNMHMVFLDMKRNDLAIQCLEKAKNLSPKTIMLDFFLAVLYAYNGRVSESARILEKISKINKISGEISSWTFIKNSCNSLPTLTGTNYRSLDLAIRHANLSGHTLEFGVFNGKSIRRIASLIHESIFGFDSFEGIPENWNDEPKGSYSAEGVLPIVPDNVTLIRGWFNESIPIFIEESNATTPIRFLHIDCDLYSSTKTIFDLLWKKIIPGTVILFDEFIGYKSWQDDEFKAFIESAKKYSWDYEIILISFATKQAAVKIKSVA
jgi:tetratricopeptide (TPR) repeat protein